MAVTVGPAMGEQIRQAADCGGLDGPAIDVNDAGNSAHVYTAS
jgi:hypothetical protein